MLNQELESQVLASIVGRLGIENKNSESISYDVPLFSAYDEDGVGLQLDSIDSLEVVIAIKKDFDVKIGDEEMEALRNITSIANHIRKIKNIP